MATTMNPAYERLRNLLGELFQFDRADLDFGIYRVMNQKREEIAQFLDRDLLPQVREVLASLKDDERARLAEELEKARQAAIALRVTPESTPAYQDIKRQLDEGQSALDRENEVYSDLYTFFSRYYRDGDFISLRRYKQGVYAIPYEGEEVKLHWANADQYYIKTAENFQDYRFRLAGGRHAHFRLVAAETERDNNKAQEGQERRFRLREDEPVQEIGDELHIFFEYRPTTEKQADLNATATKTILDDAAAETWREALSQSMPTTSNSSRTLLDKHLADYTAKNSFDYFIHKDLGGFLRRELDFFLKNEVAHLDDLDTADERRANHYLARLRAIKRIGHKIIDFLAQLEDFQKRLYLKKKFLVAAEYCLTIDRVPKELHEAILVKDEQWEEWERLYMLSELPEAGDRAALLASQPHLVLDTRFFNAAFKQALLSSIEKLDDQTDGLLINSDNFQALSLIATRYQGNTNVIFIDPPYNTGVDGFPYKDRYQHSSWLSMMENRLNACKPLLSKEGLVFITIDFVEVSRLRLLCDDVFGTQNFLADIAWEKRYTRSNNANRFYSLKDTVLAYRASEELERLREARSEKSKANYTNPDNDERGPWISSSYVNPATKERRPNLTYGIRNPFTNSWVSHPTHAWKYEQETFEAHVADNRLYWGEKGEYEYPRLKSFLSEADPGMVPIDLWHYKETGTTDDGGKEIKALFGRAVFDNPKPTTLVRRALQLDPLNGDNTLVMDFFAGSGTTGHAAINLNREDDGHRKYILVEMGEYFDSVLKPRIQKAIYSRDWEDGKPVSREGSSHCFKYLKLESYEDTLNNLRLEQSPVQRSLFEENQPAREEYLLSYMLSIETAGSTSLLSVDGLTDPFSYQLHISQGGETQPRPIDLPETFNWLLGLRVERMRFVDGFQTVEGLDPEGKPVLVIWRCRSNPDHDDARLEEFFTAQGYADRSADEQFDRIYVNGDCTLQRLRPTGATWDVLLTEEAFSRLMFAGEGGI